MNSFSVMLLDHRLDCRPSGALWWPEQHTLIVADMHLGKPARIARRSGATLPPYADAETLDRLEREVAATGASRVISLGDGFDDDRAAQDLPEDSCRALERIMAGRDWVWISGNHDPAPPPFGGTCLPELEIGRLILRHIADPAAAGEISGHYHPKARLSLRGTGLSRAAFLVDRCRIMLPAFGAYTGGLPCSDPALTGLMRPDALAVLTGDRALPVPMPRDAPAAQLTPAPPRAFG